MRYMEAIKKWLGELTEVALLLIALGIVIQILFGGSETAIPFFGGIVTNLTKLISSRDKLRRISQKQVPEFLGLLFEHCRTERPHFSQAIVFVSRGFFRYRRQLSSKHEIPRVVFCCDDNKRCIEWPCYLLSQ